MNFQVITTRVFGFFIVICQQKKGAWFAHFAWAKNQWWNICFRWWWTHKSVAPGGNNGGNVVGGKSPAVSFGVPEAPLEIKPIASFAKNGEKIFPPKKTRDFFQAKSAKSQVSCRRPVRFGFFFGVRNSGSHIWKGCIFTMPPTDPPSNPVQFRQVKASCRSIVAIMCLCIGNPCLIWMYQSVRVVAAPTQVYECIFAFLRGGEVCMHVNSKNECQECQREVSIWEREGVSLRKSLKPWGPPKVYIFKGFLVAITWFKKATKTCINFHGFLGGKNGNCNPWLPWFLGLNMWPCGWLDTSIGEV